MLQRMLQLNA